MAYPPWHTLHKQKNMVLVWNKVSDLKFLQDSVLAHTTDNRDQSHPQLR
jgi:hypothetical protein